MESPHFLQLSVCFLFLLPHLSHSAPHLRGWLADTRRYASLSLCLSLSLCSWKCLWNFFKFAAVSGMSRCWDWRNLLSLLHLIPLVSLSCHGVPGLSLSLNKSHFFCGLYWFFAYILFPKVFHLQGISDWWRVRSPYETRESIADHYPFEFLFFLYVEIYKNNKKLHLVQTEQSSLIRFEFVLIFGKLG